MDISNLAERFDNYNAQVQKLADSVAEFQTSIDRVEVELKRPRDGGEWRKDGLAAKRKAFEKLLRYGPERLDHDERQAAVIVADDAKGGYLSPPEFVQEVIRNLVQFSPVRQLARIGNTASGEVLIPKRTATGTAYWTGETETRLEAQPAYGQERIPINECAAFIDVSVQMLEDSAIDMTAELAVGLGEEFGRLEGLAGISGSGVKQPEGVLSNSSVPTVASGASASITADALISMLYSLPPFYRNRSTWVCSGATLAAIRKIKDGSGQYLLQPGLAVDRPDTLLSRPILEAVDVPEIAASATPVILGSWSDGYRIYDRVYLSILRDNFTQALTGKVRFWARRRVGMGVVQAAAFRKMVISAS